MSSPATQRLRRAILIAGVIVSVGSTMLFASDAARLPRSAFPGVQSIDTIERREMPWVDVAALRAEDAARERSPLPVAPRFAKKMDAGFTLDNSGTWETLDDGSRLWRLRISSPGALSLNLGLDTFDLPEDATFWVHAANGSRVQGPYTRDDRNARGGLWTAVVFGDELVAELRLPSGAQADLYITSVNHGYRFFGERETSISDKRGPCHINVVCPEGNSWRDQIRSVAKITISGMFLCTGQLVNNTAEDLTPYLLTAKHCIEQASEAPSVVAYWNFQSPSCEDEAGGNTSQNQSGSTLVASSELEGGSDFALLLLDQEPQPSFNVYYAGWDARDQLPAATTTIHHPSGDEKSITFDYDPPTITSYGGNLTPGDGRYLRVADWDEASTEGGSSGGCLFDSATKRCVGTLSGGIAACGNDDPDWFAWTHAQWTGEGTPETRLSDWLDALDSGVLFLDGKNGTGVGSEQIWLVPAAASLKGAGESDWKSQISVVNPTNETRLASIYFVEKNQAWPGELLSGPSPIAAKGSLYVDDPLKSLKPTSGLVYVMVDGQGTAVFVRTYNLVADGSTFGQGQPGVLLSAASSQTELILPLIHSSPSVYRTNVGFSQTSTGAYRVKVEIYSSSGALLAQKSYSQAAAWRQVNNIFKDMGIGNDIVDGGWIRVTLVDGSPSYWTTYATVIDDTTNDPTYVLPVAP